MKLLKIRINLDKASDDIDNFYSDIDECLGQIAVRMSMRGHTGPIANRHGQVVGAYTVVDE